MDMGNRQIAFKALVGSHNYGLNTEESDKDYKVFVIPTFDDLYKGEKYSKQIVGETEDYDIHDIRKLSNLFFKANINFIEVLYSKEIVLGKGLSPFQENQISKLFELRDEIVKMNLPYLFNACGGMYNQKMKLLRKGTKGTQHLVDAFEYDTKQAMHAYRVLNFIDRFAQTDFEDFKWAITYEGQERDFMIDIKHGFFDVKSFENFATFYHDSKFKTLKSRYHEQIVNKDLREEIESIIMELVRSNF